MLLIASVLLAVQAAASPGERRVAPDRPDPSHVAREAWVMGTRLRVVTEGACPAEARHVAESVLRNVEAAERLLSTWDTATPLSRLNRSRPGHLLAIEPELARLLGEVLAWSRRTERTFDPAIGPLVDAWDIRGAGRVPGEHEVARALTASGPDHFRVLAGAAARLSPGSWIDSGAFGKGAALRVVRDDFAADSATGRRVLVDLGGQILAMAPAHEPFTIQVAHPHDRRTSVAELSLASGSVATSGDSERPGHVLDPRSGYPVEAWGSVTVVSADALEADVLSTALYVMGPERGLAWARRAGVAALFLRDEAGSVVASWSPEMSPWLVGAPSLPTSTTHHRTRPTP